MNSSCRTRSSRVVRWDWSVRLRFLYQLKPSRLRRIKVAVPKMLRRRFSLGFSGAIFGYSDDVEGDFAVLGGLSFVVPGESLEGRIALHLGGVNDGGLGIGIVRFAFDGDLSEFFLSLVLVDLKSGDADA